MKDEHDPHNIKIATRLSIRSASDDDLLFLKQLGLQWVYAELGVEAPYAVGAGSDAIRRTLLPNSRRVRWLSARRNQ